MIVRSVLSNWVALAVSVVTSLAVTPILIHGLGHYEYGLWFLASSLVDYFGLLDVGIRATLQRFVARQQAAGKRQALDETFSTGIALTLAVCLAIPACTGGLALLLSHIFVVNEASRPLFVWLVVLLGVTVSVTVLARFLGAYLCGFGRFDLYNLAAIVATLLRTALIVVLMWFALGALGVVVATLASALVMVALHWAFIRRLDPDLKFSVSRVKARRGRELVSFSVYIVLWTAGEYVWTYSAPVIIARALGVALVTPFSIAARLMDNFRFVMMGMIGPLMPRMSALYGEEREADLRALTLRATRLTALLSSLIAWILILSGDEFIAVWLGPGFDVSVTLMHVLLIGVVIGQIQSPAGPLLIAVGRHRAFAFWTMGEAVATVLLSLYCVRDYGLLGIAVAMTLPRAIVKTTIQPWYVLRVLGTSFGEFFRLSLLRPAIVNGLFLAIALATGAFAPTSGVTEFLWAATWQSTVFLALAYAIGLTPASRHMVGDRLRALRWPAVPAPGGREAARIE